MSCEVKLVVLLTSAALSVAGAQFGNIFITIPRHLRDTDLQNDENTGRCASLSSCVPISTCPFIEDLLDQSCFASDRYFHRLSSLTCGHSNNEDYVCCPPGGYDQLATPGDSRSREQICGEIMVKGMDYDGIGSQPWVARIGFTNKETGNVRFACSGSIISKRVVLTAAHCALAKPEGYKLSTVVVGEWDTERAVDCGELFCAAPAQALAVASVIEHPGYEPRVFRHDVALLVLRDEIKYTVTAAPVCLNESPEELVGQRATLVGWGKLSGQMTQVSRQQRMEVPVVALGACEAVFGAAVPVHEGQLCAGGEAGRDACSGFGGAPLLVKRAGRYTQVGIVSFGSENCGNEGVPSVYTKVAHYYQWIVENSPMS